MKGRGIKRDRQERALERRQNDIKTHRRIISETKPDAKNADQKITHYKRLASLAESEVETLKHRLNKND